MDTIIGALPIALHLSVLLFFVGATLWMWDTHRSIFAVVVLCGALAVLFYISTTTLAIFCPSCPYRTPLASWIYTLLHFLFIFLSRFAWFAQWESGRDKSEAKMEGGTATDSQHDTSSFRRLMIGLHLRFGQPSLISRDDIYIRSPDKRLMLNSLVWLSNHISISLEVYRRLLVLINGFSSVIDTVVEPSSVMPNVPWRDIFHVLGVVYKSFVKDLDLDEEAFTEFARQTHCLSQWGLKEILESLSGSKEAWIEDSDDVPIRLLYVWTQSISSHTSDTLRMQRFSDEVTMQDLIKSISSKPKDLLATWFTLLSDEAKTCERILPQLLGTLGSGSRETTERRLDAVLYLLSTGRLPWESTVRVDYSGRGNWRDFPPSPFVRRLRVLDWVDSLHEHPQNGIILEKLCTFRMRSSLKVLLTRNKPTDEEEAELTRMGIGNLSRWTRFEERLCAALLTFDAILGAEYQEESTSKQDMVRWMVGILCEDLMDVGVTLDSAYFGEEMRFSQAKALQDLSSPILRFLACVMGITWPLGRLPKLSAWERDSRDSVAWRRVSEVFFKDPSISEGDCTVLWQLRLQQWSQFHLLITFKYLLSALSDLKNLERMEKEIKHLHIGVHHAEDLIPVLIHLNCAYGWNGSLARLWCFIPDMLAGNTTLHHYDGISKDCIERLAFNLQKVSADPKRLIRLLTELIRADINYGVNDRKPQILFNLLQHAKSRLSSQDLRPVAPSCRRLARYIKESYKQFVDDWDKVFMCHGFLHDPQQPQIGAEKGKLDAVYEEVLGLLEPMEIWDGEVNDISWPRHLLRPTGTRRNPFREDGEPGAIQHQLEWGVINITINNDDDRQNEDAGPGLQHGPKSLGEVSAVVVGGDIKEDDGVE
ncbi:hypothetical protein FRC18_003106 [Serendipita sp. 400]|nr:hypothetical protein FRC18_003106 [Serendipita sp. 400]